MGSQGASNVRMIKEIMLVPLPRAASSRLMSFLTFHISIWGAASASMREIRCAVSRGRQSTEEQLLGWVGLRSSQPRSRKEC